MSRPEAHLAADLELAVRVHPSRRHLARFVAPNEPYFPLVDTNWALLHRLDYNEAEIFLKNRASKGFTSIMVVLVVQHGLFDYPDRQGEWMFEPHPEPFAEDGRPPSLDEGADKYRPDISRPNPTFWAHVDRVVHLAATLGITITFLPTWARWVNGGYWGRPILFGLDKAGLALAEGYGRFLGERYPFHPWYLGGDGNRFWNPDIKSLLTAGTAPGDLAVTDFGPVFEAMGRGIIAGEQTAIGRLSGGLAERARGYTTFMAFHPAQPWLPSAPEALASSEWPTASWLSLDGCQTGHHDGWKDTDVNTDKAQDQTNEEEGASKAQSGASPLPMWLARSSYVPIRKMYAARTGTGEGEELPRPCMDLEPHYEMIHPGFDWSKPYWNGDDIRNGAWQAVFAGAAGYTYGCCSLIQFHNDQSTTHKPILPPCTSYTNWWHELDLPGAFSVAAQRRIMLALPNFYSRVPDQSFILSDTHELADGTPAGDRLVGGMRGEGWAMVHLPYGGEVVVDLARAFPVSALEGEGEGESVPGSRFNAWWINPRDGSRLPPFASGVVPRSNTNGQVNGNGNGDGDGHATFTATSPSAGSLKDDWLLYLDVPSAMDVWPGGLGQGKNLGLVGV